MNNGGTITAMQDIDMIRRDDLHRADSLEEENADDVELAYALQNARNNDPDLLARLIYRFASDLYRWVGVSLYYRHRLEPSQAEILSVMQLVFSYAIRHVGQFHGQASVVTWLFGIAYQLVRPPLFPEIIIYLNRRMGAQDAVLGMDGWQRLEAFPEKLRTALILRYMFGLRLADIAGIIGVQLMQVHKRLVKGRQRFLRRARTSHMEASLQAYVDGFYDEDPDGLSRIIGHVESCEECRSSIMQLGSLDKSLGESLKQRWPSVTLDELHLGAFASSIITEKQPPINRWIPKIRISQAVWVLGLVGVFILMASVFIRLTPAGGEFPQVEDTPSPVLPAIINQQLEIMSSIDASSSVQTPQLVDPAISADGNWAVFSSIRISSATQRMGMTTINLYNRQNNTTRVIGESTSSFQMPWAWSDLAPSISAEGQRVLYVSSTNAPTVSGYACQTRDEQSCLDIFLFDQQTGSTRRLTQSVAGGPADGDSLAPVISADGQWVAFWSAADNLVQGDTDTCQPAQATISCMYIYLYNLQTETIHQVPMKNDLGSDASGVDRISLSANGRFIGFTVSFMIPAENNPTYNQGTTITPAMTDIGSGDLASTHTTEAVVYDQQFGQFEFENMAQDGTPGNGASASPVLSADGRLVAFTSTSTNLLSGDRNEHSDVFIRDRQSRKVRLVSVSSQGIQGNNDSGSTFDSQNFYSINLSSNGRYVVFQSQATNLQPGVDTACAWQAIPSCNSLYVHDLQSGQTALISVVPNRDYAFFPGISGDGRWVIFTESSYNCGQPRYFCSNVIVFDRQSGWMTNLTKFNQPLPSLPWTVSSAVVLPWHTRQSTALAFSPNGKLLALGGHDSIIRIWNISDGSSLINQSHPDVILQIPGNNDFTTMAFSQDGGWLAAGTTTGIVDIWSLSDNRLLYALGTQSAPIQRLVFSQDGDHLLISSLTDTWIWTISQGKLVQEANIVAEPPEVITLDLSPNGNLLASARADGTVWLQELPSGLLIARLGGQSLSMGNLAFSSDGSMLATRPADGGINLWTIKTGVNGVQDVTLLSDIHYNGYIGPMAFSPDNEYLVSTSLPGELTLWSLPDGKMFALSNPVPQGMGYALAVSQAGNMLAAGFDNEIVIWGLPPNYSSSYYLQSPTDIYVDSPPLPPATANDIPALGATDNTQQGLSLAQAAARLKFPLVIPTRLPNGLIFQDATVHQDGSVELRYVAYENRSYPASLYVYEKIFDQSFPPTMTIGASSMIVPLEVDTPGGRIYADYVRGDWALSESITPPQDGSLYGVEHNVWTWDNTSNSQRLRWEQNEILLALYYQVETRYQPALSSIGLLGGNTQVNSFIDQSDLVQIANGMGWYSQVDSSLSDYSEAIISGRLPCSRGCLLLGQQLRHRPAGASIVER